jgi:hypothetical protein
MIINPLWFYLISVSSNLQIACVVIAIFAFVFIFVGLLMYPILEDMGADLKGWGPKLMIIGIVCTFISILTPSKETCYQMMVASLVTKENIEMTAEAGKEAVDYIVNSIDKLLDEQEED